MMLYFFIFISLFSLVTVNLLWRVFLSKTKHQYAYTVIWQFLCGLLAIVFIPFERFSFSISGSVLLLLFLGIIFSAVSDATKFSAYKYEEASVLAGILPLYNVVAVVVSVIIFKSLFTSAMFFGLLLIMIATFLVTFHKRKGKFSKGVMFALFYCVCGGISIGVSGGLVKSFSVAVYLMLSYMIPAALNFFLFLRPKFHEIQYEIKIQGKLIALNAAITVIAFFFYLKAFQIGNVPQVIIIESTATVLVAISAIVFLNEKQNKLRKILAALLAMIGVILVQL